MPYKFGRCQCKMLKQRCQVKSVAKVRCVENGEGMSDARCLAKHLDRSECVQTGQYTSHGWYGNELSMSAYIYAPVIDHCSQFQTIRLQLCNFPATSTHASKPSRTTEEAHCILFACDFMPNHTHYGHMAICSETL